LPSTIHSAWLLIATFGLASGGCRQEPRPESEKVSGADAALAQTPPGGGDARDGGASSDGSSDAGQPDAAPPAAGDWIETVFYKYRFEGLKACEAGRASPDAGAATAAGPPAKPATTVVGALIFTTAVVNQLFVSPRDFSLERGGLILNARYPDPPALPACSPAFMHKYLGRGKTARGFVLFDVPPSFRLASGPIQFVYKPTRWGGAPRAAITIPDCFDGCPSSKINDQGKTSRRRSDKKPGR
jgi:hypothetical protein